MRRFVLTWFALGLLLSCDSDRHAIVSEGRVGEGSGMRPDQLVVRWTRHFTGTERAVFPKGPPPQFGPFVVASENTWWRTWSGPGVAGALFASTSGRPPSQVGTVADSGTLDVGQDHFGLVRREPARIENAFVAWRAVAASPGDDSALAAAVAAEIEALEDARAFGGNFGALPSQVKVRLGAREGSKRHVTAAADYVSFDKPARLDVRGVVDLAHESRAPIRFTANGEWTVPMFNLRGDYEMRGTFQYEASWAYGHDLPRATTP